jgi:hypothetical protein
MIYFFYFSPSFLFFSFLFFFPFLFFLSFFLFPFFSFLFLFLVFTHGFRSPQQPGPNHEPCPERGTARGRGGGGDSTWARRQRLLLRCIGESTVHAGEVEEATALVQGSGDRARGQRKRHSGDAVKEAARGRSDVGTGWAQSELLASA